MAGLMAKYQQYDEYRDSGVEWLGEVPNHWEVIKGGYIGDLFGSESVLESHVVDDGDLPFIKVSTLSTDGFSIDSPEWFISRKADKFVRTRKNYIVFPKRGAAIFTNKVNIINIPSVIDPNLMGWKVNERAISEYVAFLLKTRRLDDIADVSTVPQINNKHINPQKFPLPPIEEQTQIISFLDYETAQIDTLIDKQQTLIKLLKEKRQAVISHAVTKGLNPNAPMKDSGVEWLGDVPEHWTVCAVKHILATPITDGPHETPVFLDEGVPFISAEAVSQGYINFDKKRAYISALDNEKYSKKYSPKKYDIYIVKSGATTGVSAIVETDGEFNIWSPLAVIRCAAYCEPYFTLFAIRAKYFQEAIRLNWNYGTQQNIGMAVLGNLLIAYPPKEEAQKISDYLKATAEKMNELIERAEKAIQLMQERRTALISAAVTGKIDVRGWVEPKASSAQ